MRLAAPTCLQPEAHQQFEQGAVTTPKAQGSRSACVMVCMASLQNIWQLLFSAWLATCGSLSLASSRSQVN